MADTLDTLPLLFSQLEEEERVAHYRSKITDLGWQFRDEGPPFGLVWSASFDNGRVGSYREAQTLSRLASEVERAHQKHFAPRAPRAPVRGQAATAPLPSSAAGDTHE